jgi:uncharacterized NAD(P)/FAD-binding protein YdhS
MQKVDIALIGSGIACTATLTEVFRKLVDGAPAEKKISIAVIEKHEEFWLGIPYGSRSSVNALTITSIADFFTDENRRMLFFEWFKLHKGAIIEEYLLKGGLSATLWLERNGKAMADDDWKNVYLPRFIFGRYYREIFNGLLQTVTEKELAEVTLINAEGIDAKPVTGGYEVNYENADKTTGKLTAAKLVIATGSAPVRDVTVPDTDAVSFINNLYEPRVDDNIKKLKDALLFVENTADRNVLIIGTNASSIEFLYLLAGLPEITGMINKLVLISRSGLLPYHIIDKKLDSYPCENLDKLKAEGNYTITTLVEAAMQDLKPAVKDGVIIPYIDRIIGYTIELLQALDEDAKKAFLGVHGMQLSNQFRRSGTDYKGGEAVLHEIEKLTLLKGAFEKIGPLANGGLLHYTNSDTGEHKVFASPFKVVINCTGADDLDKSTSRLIYNLVHNKIAKVNLSGKGFYVNENFEAAPNLYIMGPLLGGNMNKRIHFWHLENASRIMYLAPFLAECLLEKL